LKNVNFKGVKMSKYLLIVESPAKCGKIKSYLGADYIVMASVGHIKQIPKKGMNIDIKNGFEPTYEITPDKKDVAKKIKEASKGVEKIYLASDPDREGSAIAWEVYNLFDEKCKKKCTRIMFNEINKNAILKAIQNETKIESHLPLINAAKARQVLDRLIGYKISPILWYTVGTGTSAGRVQSIALKMICQKEKEISEFKPQDFWYIDAMLGCEKGEFSARVVTKDKDNRYLDEKITTADFENLKKAQFHLDKIEKNERTVKPQAPFDTASLQTTCSSVFGWSIKKTASLSQTLYEQGKVSYIRTDSFNISEEALTEVRDFIKKGCGNSYLPSKANVYAKKSKASAQEAHECIRPTHCEDDGSNIDNSDEQKLYNLIRTRFIACQMTPMLVDTVVYNVKASSKHDLIAKGQTIKFDGWFKIYKYTSTKDEVLPEAKEKEKLTLKDIKKTKNTTQPPSRYNGGSLVKKMEGEGVGRPSTYAAIIEALYKRDYIKDLEGAKKGVFQATDLGMRVFNYLDPNFKDFFMDVAFTASVEDDLDKITNGEKDYLGVVGDVYKVMQDEIKKADAVEKKDVTTGEACLVCKTGSIVKKHGKFGDFWTCDHYSKDDEGCKAIYVKDENGKFSIKEKKLSGEDTGAKCSECKKGKIVLKKGKFGDFYCCAEYPSCKSVFIKNEDGKFSIKGKKESGKASGITCFVCKKGKIVTRDGQYGEWHSCNNYPSCKSVFIKGDDGKFELKKKSWGKGQTNKNAKNNESNSESKEKDGLEFLEED
jgi:DNA topoisomerase I